MKHPAMELKINPHTGQKMMLETKKRIILVSSGLQSGKTISGPVWMYLEMLRCGDGEYLAAAPTFPLSNMKLIPSYVDFFVRTLGISEPGDYKKADNILEVHGGGLNCKIFFGSAANPDSLESMTALAVHCDEGDQEKFSQAAWNAVKGRVSRSNGRILITSTVYVMGWVYREVFLPWEKDPINSDIEVIQFDSIISPGFNRENYFDQQRKMPSYIFDRRYRGLFSSPAGQIYSDFNEQIHLVKPFTIPGQWNWHVGIDPGAVHTALVWIAEDPQSGKFYIVDSYLSGNKSTKEHIRATMQHHAYSKVVDWRGGAGNEQQFRDDWTSEGIPVQESAIRNVEAMINRVIALLKEEKLFVFNNERNTVSNEETGEKSLLDEFRTFSRKLGDDGKPTEDILNEKLYHKLAAVRYFASKINTEGDWSSKVEMVNAKIPTMGLTSGFSTNQYFHKMKVPVYR